MSRKQILEELKKILMSDEYLVLKDRLDDLSEQISLVDDFAFDSLQILNFVVLIEQKFGFTSESEELNLDMFNDMSMLIDFIQSKQSAVNKE